MFLHVLYGKKKKKVESLLQSALKIELENIDINKDNTKSNIHKITPHGHCFILIRNSQISTYNY